MKKISAIFFKISLKNRKKYLLRENYKKKKKQTSYRTVTSFSIYLPRSLFFICLFSLFVTNLSRASSFLMKDNLFPIKRNIDLSSSWFIKTYTCSRGLFSIVEEILTILRNVLWIEHPTKWNVENHIIKERKLFSFVQSIYPVNKKEFIEFWEQRPLNEMSSGRITESQYCG